MKHFVIGTNRTTPEQDAQFLKILRERWSRLGWWHQVGETWLVIDATDTLTVTDLRDAAMVAFPGIYLMVLQVLPLNWSGFGPNDTMFPWMREWWERKP